MSSYWQHRWHHPSIAALEMWATTACEVISLRLDAHVAVTCIMVEFQVSNDAVPTYFNEPHQQTSLPEELKRITLSV